MEFTYYIETAPNTTEESPARVSTPLAIGMLQQVYVGFPWGCAGLVGLRILHYEHVLTPTNPDEWLTGNGILIDFPSEYTITEGHGEFKVECYNEDDFYTHTPFVIFVVLRGGLVIPPSTSWIGA